MFHSAVTSQFHQTDQHVICMHLGKYFPPNVRTAFERPILFKKHSIGSNYFRQKTRGFPEIISTGAEFPATGDFQYRTGDSSGSDACISSDRTAKMDPEYSQQRSWYLSRTILRPDLASGQSDWVMALLILNLLLKLLPMLLQRLLLADLVLDALLTLD